MAADGQAISCLRSHHHLQPASMTVRLLSHISPVRIAI